MAKFLYADFLENKREYNLAQAFWNRLLTSLLREYGYTYTPYINQMQNGEKEYDGNPIFSAFIPEIERAIRIIQVSPDEEGDDISAWIDDIELGRKTKTKKTKELVLDLKLSKEAKMLARDLIKRWIMNQFDDATLDQLLEREMN
ncbi:hypothetical protein [Flavilitoribacter nigricans]|uniref:Uncharacterized protein n=1 Tax=Flavilitoribacter nigricans (strain ATCC 23147 / DSM 23189 / NBRC 102662 / NCIMB 1420 / SS-2) TaxID=1122177 RepID=A0A2D0N0J4_FLAN2|nr:hypothetical protein [Flavilitoribacter nigricans]PHN01669.1 hypothetical protein CRP01_36235 [Flavilitoribacter nigricans DSM 23189 = NBRC 102662]